MSNIVTKTIKAGTKEWTNAKGEHKSLSWPEGEISLEVPQLDKWTKEQLKNFSEVVARKFVHYEPSSEYRRKEGKLEDDSSGPFLVKDGVFKFNPDWVHGSTSSPRRAEKIAELEATFGRKLTGEEIAKFISGGIL